MDALQLFQYENHKIRVVQGKDGEPWFVAADVAEVLGYANSRKAVADHCKVVMKRDTLTNGGVQALSIIPERDVYRLIMRSKLPKAQEFEEWVVGTVLPSLRKHGGYAMGTFSIPRTLPEALRLAASLEEERAALESKVRADAPLVALGEAVEGCVNTITVGEMAKILASNGVPTGEKRLFSWLRANGYLTSGLRGEKNRPMQWVIDEGLMTVRETPWWSADGLGRLVSIQPRITGKGQRHLVNKLGRIAA